MIKKVISIFIVLSMSVFVFSPYAKATETRGIPDDPLGILDVSVISETETNIIYTVFDNETKSYLWYEEETITFWGSETIYTKVYSIKDNQKDVLLDEYETTIIFDQPNNTLVITQISKNSTANKTQISFENPPSLTPPGYVISDPTVELDSIEKTASNKSYLPQLNLSYFKNYTTKKGQITWSTMGKCGCDINNYYYDKATMNINSMQGYEKDLGYSTPVLGIIAYLINNKFKISFSLVKKTVFSMGYGLYIAWTVTWWLYEYDKFITNWSRIPQAAIGGFSKPFKSCP